jgi:hypothetical protein
MTPLSDIREEIDRLSNRRAELWHILSEGHDPAAAEELHLLEKRLDALWDEQRAIKARIRFGEPQSIIARARLEERLSRAA